MKRIKNKSNGSWKKTFLTPRKKLTQNTKNIKNKLKKSRNLIIFFHNA
jgi:hypothetical protein